MQHEFLIPKFLEAMNDIGRYGHEKYGKDSLHHRALIGDRSRGTLARTLSHVIAQHSADHFTAHLHGIPHDHFNTRRHQLAAVAFNAMMEFYFAGLGDEGSTYRDKLLTAPTEEVSLQAESLGANYTPGPRQARPLSDRGVSNDLPR